MNTSIVALFLFELIIFTLLFCTVPLIMKYKHGPYSFKESTEISFIVCLIITMIILLFSMLTSEIIVEVPVENSNGKSLAEQMIDGTYVPGSYNKTEKKLVLENLNFTIVPSIIFFILDICILNIGYKKQHSK